MSHKNKTRVDRLSSFFSRHRIMVTAVVLIITAIFAGGMGKVNSQIQFYEMFPMTTPF